MSEYIGMLDVFPDFVFIPERISEGDRWASRNFLGTSNPRTTSNLPGRATNRTLASSAHPTLEPRCEGRAVCLTWRCEVNGEEGPSGICECTAAKLPHTLALPARMPLALVLGLLASPHAPCPRAWLACQPACPLPSCLACLPSLLAWLACPACLPGLLAWLACSLPSSMTEECNLQSGFRGCDLPTPLFSALVAQPSMQ